MSEIRDSEITLWINRWVLKITKITKSRIVTSFSIFFIPLIVSGIILQIIYKYPIFTSGIVIALLWLAIAPFLLYQAVVTINNFFSKNEHIFKNINEFNNIRIDELKKIQSRRYLIFGIPWALITSSAVLFSYDNAPIIIKVWIFISFFIVFLLSAIGFRGILISTTLFHRIEKAKLQFNPFHPDEFGGFADLGNFAVKATLLFSSGSLVLPLAFDIIKKYSNEMVHLYYLVYILSGFYIICVLFSFLVPIIKVMNIVNPRTEEIRLDFRIKLDKMVNDFRKKDNIDYKKIADILMFYNFSFLKLPKIRKYPYDFKIMFEFFISLIIPIIVTVMGILLGK